MRRRRLGPARGAGRGAVPRWAGPSSSLLSPPLPSPSGAWAPRAPADSASAREVVAGQGEQEPASPAAPWREQGCCGAGAEAGRAALPFQPRFLCCSAWLARAWPAPSSPRLLPHQPPPPRNPAFPHGGLGQPGGCSDTGLFFRPRCNPSFLTVTSLAPSFRNKSVHFYLCVYKYK